MNPEDLTLSLLLSAFQGAPKTDHMKRLAALMDRASEQEDVATSSILMSLFLTARVHSLTGLLHLVIKELGFNLPVKDYGDLLATLNEKSLEKELKEASESMSMDEFFATTEMILNHARKRPFEDMFNHLRDKNEEDE